MTSLAGKLNHEFVMSQFLSPSVQAPDALKYSASFNPDTRDRPDCREQ